MRHGRWVGRGGSDDEEVVRPEDGSHPELVTALYSFGPVVSSVVSGRLHSRPEQC